mgnify:CR=1 FL=1
MDEEHEWGGQDEHCSKMLEISKWWKLYFGYIKLRYLIIKTGKRYNKLRFTRWDIGNISNFPGKWYLTKKYARKSLLG